MNPLPCLGVEILPGTWKPCGSTQNVGSSLGCGMAMLHGPAGESPAQKAASHGSGIEPCRRTSDGALDA